MNKQTFVLEYDPDRHSFDEAKEHARHIELKTGACVVPVRNDLSLRPIAQWPSDTDKALGSATYERLDGPRRRSGVKVTLISNHRKGCPLRTPADVAWVMGHWRTPGDPPPAPAGRRPSAAPGKRGCKCTSVAPVVRNLGQKKRKAPRGD